MQIISRAEAHAQGRTHFYNGNPCRRGHVAQRFVSTGGCVECGKLYSEKFAADKRNAMARNFDAKKAELLPVDIHVPVAYHIELFQFIDYLLSRDGRPPCGYPKPDVPPAVSTDKRTAREKMWDMHAPRTGRAHAERVCAQLPDEHSEGWVPAAAMDDLPETSGSYGGGNMPSFLK
jgi:hypothetical protein